MHCGYRDILNVMGEPQWWDEVAVPRYCDFAPDESHNIYAKQVALVEIACQDCGRRFKVTFSSTPVWDEALKGMPKDWLVRRVENKSLHYGDPPNAGCCPCGPTMNCEDLQVLEFWEQAGFEWRRRPELEIALLEGE